EQVGSMGGGFQLGGTVDYEFKHHWMLMSGLTWMQTRSSMELFNASVPYFPDTEIKMNHLNIPIKIGYNIRINKSLSLIPYIGVYGSINFNAGKCDVKNPYYTGETNHWKPMDGYSYIVPTEADIPYEYEATIDAFRRWNYGAVGGMKAVIAGRYTVSLQYYESIKKVQKQCNLRNYGYQLSVGYQF
ncbi:MAG: outer membrane beta-barrel protein, partial [Bacteroides uniformis]|nr:outer membrane beta-barrel protein [Bacteroides uniformis]